MLSKKIIFSLCLIVVTVSIVLLFALSPSAQSVSQRVLQRVFGFSVTRVEYAAITRAYAQSPPITKLDTFHGFIEITYFEYSYDRITLKKSYLKKILISEELNYAEFLQDSCSPQSKPQDIENRKAASARAIDLALAKAMFTMGEQGWELVGPSFRTYSFENFENGKPTSTTEIRTDIELGTVAPMFEPKLRSPIYFKKLRYGGSY